MSSAWRILSGRDELGTVRTSPHQFEQTCASLTGIRRGGQVLTVAAGGAASQSDADVAVQPGGAAKKPYQTLESPVVSGMVITY